ncbi:TatD family hydrolase [Candidatus Bathyarchaeota archaeon A05DMB-2]|jgi:TatD DNase family protein|nr:TatD family hydrolase [Candidatus Bathyarchaeota archaeon A05DMB-2]
MKLIDAHIHLSDPEYAEHVDQLVKEARDASVAALVSNSMDLETSKGSLRLAEKHPNLVFPALGIHPWNVNVLKESELEETVKLITEQSRKKVVTAIGEIGLDYKYEAIWAKQLMVFEKMLRLAEELELPVIIHSRGTTQKIVDMLPSYRLNRVLLHWFSHPINALYKAVDHGYLITEGPPVAYSNGIREVVKKVPLTNLLTETDGPVTYRKAPYGGRMTSPSFIPTVVESIAEVKGMAVVDVADQIARNFEGFFNIKLR